MSGQWFSTKGPVLDSLVGVGIIFFEKCRFPCRPPGQFHVSFVRRVSPGRLQTLEQETPASGRRAGAEEAKAALPPLSTISHPHL